MSGQYSVISGQYSVISGQYSVVSDGRADRTDLITTTVS